MQQYFNLLGFNKIDISLKNVVFSVIFFVKMNYANSLNRIIPSEQRATILSIDSMLYSLFMIILFPLNGLVADKLNLSYRFFALGILQVVLMVILSRKKR